MQFLFKLLTMNICLLYLMQIKNELLIMRNISTTVEIQILNAVNSGIFPQEKKLSCLINAN